MAEEIAALEQTDTWDPVPCPLCVHPITCSGSIRLRLALILERYKARLVAHSFQ
jgi:hypothetical protein